MIQSKERLMTAHGSEPLWICPDCDCLVRVTDGGGSTAEQCDSCTTFLLTEDDRRAAEKSWPS